MQNHKSSKNSTKNIQTAFSELYKYKSLTKLHNNSQKQTISKENLVAKETINRISYLDKNTLKKKITCKKHANLRTFTFQDVVSSKINTENSSLCASIQKPKNRNSIMNVVGKQSRKVGSNFSTYQQISNNKNCNKSISIFCPQSDKKTVKTKKVNSRSQMQVILVRTKSVLEGWMNEKQNWMEQKQIYQDKIKNLSSQIDFLKQKLTLNDKDIKLKKSHVLVAK